MGTADISGGTPFKLYRCLDDSWLLLYQNMIVFLQHIQSDTFHIVMESNCDSSSLYVVVFSAVGLVVTAMQKVPILEIFSTSQIKGFLAVLKVQLSSYSTYLDLSYSVAMKQNIITQTVHYHLHYI